MRDEERFKAILFVVMLALSFGVGMALQHEPNDRVCVARGPARLVGRVWVRPCITWAMR